MLPTLVPPIQEIGMRCCSSTCSTPRCANPRAKPPPNARPIPGRGAGIARSNGPIWWFCFTPRECQRLQGAPMGRASRKNSTDVLRCPQRTKIGKFFRQYFLTTNVPSLYHWPPQYNARFSPASGRTIPEGACTARSQGGSGSL
jgi:hypothetical protein